MNLARFTVNATASSPGGFDTTAGQTLTLLLEANSSLVRRVSFQVYDPNETNPPRSSKAAPLLTLVGSTMGSRVDAANPSSPVTVATPASGAHSWIVRCIVNGGLDDNERPSPDYVFERMVCIRNNGRRKIVASEGTQYEPDGWAGAQNDDVDAGGGGGGGGGYVTFQDEGSALPSRAVANFTGQGVGVTDVGGITTVNIPGGPPGSAAGQTQLWSGSAWTAGALDLADADARTGTLPAGNGGTGIAGAGGVANRVLTTLNGTSWAAGLVALATMVSGQLSLASLPDGSANSVLGRATATVGAQASIAASLDGQTMRLAGGSLAFGALNLASPNAITGLMPLANLTGGSAVGQTLRNTAGNVPAWGATDLADGDAVTGQLAFANIANGSAWSVFARAAGTAGLMASLAATADGQYLQRIGGALTWATIGTGSVGVGSLAGGSAVGQVLLNTPGNVPAWGAMDLADPDARTGTLPAGNGGTGIAGAGGTADRVLVTTDGTSWSASQVALASMVSGVLPLANLTGGSAVGQVLRNTAGNLPAWGATDLADGDAVTGKLPFGNFADGSATSVFARASGTTGAFASLAATADNQFLQRVAGALTWATIGVGTIGGGTAQGQVLVNGASNVPAWAAVDLADADAVTGLLPLANMANMTAMSLLGRFTNTTGAMAAIGPGTSNQIMRVNAAGTSIGWGTIAVGAFSNAVASSVLGRSAATAGVYADIASSADGQVFRRGASGVLAWGAVDLADGDAITGQLPLANVAGASGNSGRSLISNGTSWAANGDVFANGSTTIISTGGTPYFTSDNTGVVISAPGAGDFIKLTLNGGSQRLTVFNTQTVLYSSLLTFENGVASPAITQGSIGTNGLATANPLKIIAQNRTGTGATVGANLELYAGSGATDGSLQASGNTLDLYAGKSGSTSQVLNQMANSYLDFDIASAAGASGRYDLRQSGNTMVSFSRSGGAKLGFYPGNSPVAKQTLSGSWAGAGPVVGKALAAILANLGLMVDSST